VVSSTNDSDECRHTQPTGASTSSSSASAGARHKFRLLSSLPRSLFSFDRRDSTRRRSSADTSSTAATAAAAAGGAGSDDDATTHGPHRLLVSLGLADTSIK